MNISAYSKKMQILDGPENVFRRMIHWFSGNRKYAFLSAFIAGILTYSVLMIRQPVAADPVLFMDWFVPEDWFLYSQGRWTMRILACFRGFLIEPVLCSLITIATIAALAAIVVDLFEIKNVLWVIISSIGIVVHPYFANTLMYYFMTGTPVYLFMSIPFWICYRSRMPVFWRILLAALMLTIALGSYQPSISFMTMLPVLMLILDIVSMKDRKVVWTRFGCALISCLLSCIAYMVIWKVLCKLNNISDFYGGADTYTISNTLINLPQIIVEIYQNFFSFFFQDSIVHNTYWYRDIIFCIVFALVGVNLCLYFVHNKRNKGIKIKDIIFCLAAISIIPLAAMSICLIVTKYDFYLMMAHAFVLIVPLFCKLMEQDCGRRMWKMIYQWAGLFCMVWIVWTYALSDIAGFIALHQTTTQTKDIASRVLIRLEDHEDFSYDMPVCFIGQPDDTCYNIDDNIVKASPGSTFLQQGVFPGIWENSDGWGLYIYRYCGVKLNYYSNGMQDRIRKLATTDAFTSRPCFPAEDSIGLIDGVMVVKFGEYDPSLPD